MECLTGCGGGLDAAAIRQNQPATESHYQVRADSRLSISQCDFSTSIDLIQSVSATTVAVCHPKSLHHKQHAITALIDPLTPTPGI